MEDFHPAKALEIANKKIQILEDINDDYQRLFKKQYEQNMKNSAFRLVAIIVFTGLGLGIYELAKEPVTPVIFMLGLIAAFVANPEKN